MSNIIVNYFNYRIGSAWNNIPSRFKANLKFKKRSEKRFAAKIKGFFLKDYDKPCSIPNCYICNR